MLCEEMIAIKPNVCYTGNCLDVQDRGVLLLNAVDSTHNIIVGKAPLISGFTSRCTSRQRQQANKGRFIMSNMSWDWIAGFFEGEGCISWYEQKLRTKQGVYGRIFIGQKEKEPLQRVYDFLKGEGFERVGLTLRRQAKGRNAFGKPTEIWVVSIQQRDEVIKFLEQVVDMLIQKREKAIFVLDNLKGLRGEREDKLEEALELREQGIPWREITRSMGITRVSLTNYARSKGIDIRDDREGYDKQTWRQDRIERGLCENCGNPRGEDGTIRQCRTCADKHNQRTRKRKAIIVSRGLCVNCEKPRGDNGTKILCRNCASGRKKAA